VFILFRTPPRTVYIYRNGDGSDWGPTTSVNRDKVLDSKYAGLNKICETTSHSF